MMVSVSITNDKNRFLQYEWWADNPEGFLSAIAAQMKAAAALWPELEYYRIVQNIQDHKVTPA